MLFLRWEHDDLGTQSEIDELQPLLQKLKFTPQSESLTMEQYNIPSEDPQDSLEEILVGRRNKYAKKSRQLLLIYYGGHGRMNEMRQCIWYPWLNPPPGSYERPEVDWTSLQARLHRCDGDVVFILDCCHASSMVRGGHSAWKGFKELLVASGKNEKTQGVNDNSFTRAIIRELKSLEGKATSISGLQAAMVEHQETHGLRHTPIRIGLSERANRFESLQLVYPKSPSGENSVKNIDSDALDYGSRVLISIRLRDPANPLLVRDWLPWLQSQAPQDVLDLKVNWTNFVRPEAAFDHGSTLMLFSMPLTIWNALPQDKAYAFIDIIKSGNLLSTSTGKGKERQTIPESTTGYLPASPRKRKAIDQPMERALLPTPPNSLPFGFATDERPGGESPHVNYETFDKFQPYSIGKFDDRWIVPPHIVFPWESEHLARYLVVQPKTSGKIVARHRGKMRREQSLCSLL